MAIEVIKEGSANCTAEVTIKEIGPTLLEVTCPKCTLHYTAPKL